MDQRDKDEHLFFDDEKYEEFEKGVALTFKKVYDQQNEGGSFNNLLLRELLLKVSDNFYKLAGENRDNGYDEPPSASPSPGPFMDCVDIDNEIEIESEEPINQNILSQPAPQPQEIRKYKIIRNPNFNSMTITPVVPVSKINTKEDVRGVKQNEPPIVLIKRSKKKITNKKRLHEKVHRNEKGHVCPYSKCSKSFFRINKLTQHIMLNHTNVRPYNCSVCSKAFVNRSRLKRHELLHSGEGGHCCDFCGQKYAVKESLRLHVLAKHTEKTEGEKTVSSTTTEVIKKRNTSRKIKVKVLEEISTGQIQNNDGSIIGSNKNRIENIKLVPIQDQIKLKLQSNQQQQQLMVQQHEHQQVHQQQVLQPQLQPILPSYNSLTLPSIFSSNYIKYPTSTTVISNVPPNSPLLQQQYQIPMITIPTQPSPAPQSEQSHFEIIYESNLTPNQNMVTIAGENLNYQSICNILDSI